MTIDQPEFVDLLDHPFPLEFATHSYKINKPHHFPTVTETASHLKLLKAFQMYKAKIVDTSPTEFQVKTWQIFLSNAVRRFILFVTALRRHHHIDEYYGLRFPVLPFLPTNLWNLSKALQVIIPTEVKYYKIGEQDRANWAREFATWLPPLDVVMVWHAFMLNPKTFYDVCMRNKFIQFANFPFPLFELNNAIDNTTFDYNPSTQKMNSSNWIISRFSTNPDDLVFHIHSFSMYQQMVAVYCPGCQHQLVTAPWTNNEHSGFGDEGFFARITNSSCTCSADTVVTHDSLRKRQLMADVKGDSQMPGVFKYFSHVVSKPKLKRMDPLEVSRIFEA